MGRPVPDWYGLEIVPEPEPVGYEAPELKGME